MTDAPEPRVTRAHHTGLTVRSIDRSIEFYSGLLGFPVTFRWNPRAPYIGELVGHPDVDLHAAVLEVPGADVFLELLEYRNLPVKSIDPDNSVVGTAHIAFAVEDLDGLFERLRAAGVRSVSAPVTPTIGPNRGGRAVYLIDPDGFRVELIQSSSSFAAYDPGSDGAGGCC